jgi:ribonuclease-3
MKVIAKKKLIEFIKNIELNPSEVQDFSLLNLSLTHKSYAADFSNISDHNERLEFVGDAIL